MDKMRKRASRAKGDNNTNPLSGSTVWGIAAAEFDSSSTPAPTPMSNAEGFSAWASSNGSYWTTAPGRPRLPVGIYTMENSPNVGPMFLTMRNDTDSLVDLPDSESERIIQEIATFKELRPAFKKHGFLYKRGIFLWGPPGSGKTCTVQQILKLLMQKHDSVAVMVENPHTATTCLQRLRQLEPERQVVAVMEDLDALVDRYDEAPFLALLDGESQVDNIVYVATSNYPEKLDRRFLDRPSRFDTLRYIGMPTAEARMVYLQAKVPELTEIELHDYVKHSVDYSIAHMRELIVLTRCFGHSLKESIERLNNQRIRKPNSENPPGKQAVGFFGTTAQ